MRADLERDHLEGEMREFRRLQNVVELRLHDGLASNLPSKRGLVHDGPQFERAVAAKDVLALYADIHAALDLITAGAGQSGPDHGPGVVLGLQQAGDEQ